MLENITTRCRRQAAFAFLLSVALLLLACRAGLSDWKVSEGQLLPDFQLQSTDGRTIDFRELRAKALVIARFATWCPPCQAELPALEQRVWKPLRDKGVLVMAVSSGESPDVVKEFVQRKNLTFPVLLDTEGEFARTVGGNTIPRTLLLDRDRRIVRLHIGYSQQAIDDLLSEISKLIGP